MLGKTPNKVYGPFLKAGLGYKEPERLKKAIAAQPKLYDGEKLHSAKLIIDSPDSEKILEDADETRLKIRNKMNLKELKDELIEEVQEMLNIFDSMEQKVNGKSPIENMLQNEIDRLLENQDLLITISELKNKLQTVDKGKTVNTKFDKSETFGALLCVTPFPKNIAV
ncbi:hypothetical protein Tco_0674158 [Tanacetum coccineum]